MEEKEILSPVTITEDEQTELVEASYDVSADFAKVMDSQPSIQKAKELIKERVKQSEKNNLIFRNEINSAGLFIKFFKDTFAGFENLRKAIKKPSFQYGKSIDQYFKDLNSLAADEMERLDKGIKKWIKAEQAEADRLAEEEREEAEAKLKIEQAKVQAEMKEKMIADGRSEEDAEELSQQIEAPLPVTVKAKDVKMSDVSNSGMKTRYKKTWEIIDRDKIPSEYFILDETKINKIRNAHEIDSSSTIPGVKFTKEPILSR